ncbi:hypothetical protein QBC45DRAFT_94814 [Copromyces sp. CBS 386.78]|nr:hypothetical protein QBC45DRAFT_94814 [Copromyces sp. CBS 386.78]
MLNLLHSVLDVPGLDKPTAPVKILHLSFKDFLTDPKNQSKNPFWVDEVNAHMVLATRCMDLLLEDGVIYEGMYKGVWRYCNVSEESIPPSEDDLESMKRHFGFEDNMGSHSGNEISEEIRYY